MKDMGLANKGVKEWRCRKTGVKEEQVQAKPLIRPKVRRGNELTEGSWSTVG